MKSRVNTLTMGEVARLCEVAPRTASKWFDGGLLKGYRLPWSNDRRTTKGQLVAFMKEYKVPIPKELEGVELESENETGV